MNNQITSVQVLGSGCPTCKKLFELTKQAAKELNLDIEVEYLTDIQKIIELGVMSAPVLAINGKAVLAGQLPSLEKIKKIITSNDQPTTDKSAGGCCCNNC
jgi:small redox-active disulfide protein 2